MSTDPHSRDAIVISAQPIIRYAPDIAAATTRSEDRIVLLAMLSPDQISEAGRRGARSPGSSARRT